MAIKFDPPAFLNDFTQKQKDGWDVLVSSWMDNEAEGVKAPKGQGLFYNLQKDATAGDPAKQAIPWDAFPRVIRLWFSNEADADKKRWSASDTLRPIQARKIVNNQLKDPVPLFRRQQDEYCEWFVTRTAAGKITKVTFTAEAPEYWEFIASGTKPFFDPGDPRRDLVQGNPDQLLQLYRDLLGNPAVRKEDLYWQFDVATFDAESNQWTTFAKKGDYNRLNKWTTTDGVVHLTHQANTLGAEVNLAAQSTVLRKNTAGQPVTSAEALICCSAFGGVMRSSDPTIGSGVNALARSGMSLTLANPVALYIGELLGGITGKNGENMMQGWKVIRGNQPQRMVLRANFEVPPALGFTVSDCKIANVPIQFGGQLADKIKMQLTGAAKKLLAGPFMGLPCEAKCCTHPTKPSIKEIAGTTTNCATLPASFWSRIAPVLPAPGPGLIEEMPLSVETVDAPIQPKPAFAPKRSYY